MTAHVGARPPSSAWLATGGPSAFVPTSSDNVEGTSRSRTLAIPDRRCAGDGRATVRLTRVRIDVVDDEPSGDTRALRAPTAAARTAVARSGTTHSGLGLRPAGATLFVNEAVGSGFHAAPPKG
jgi:hypothetical protein